MFRMGKLQTPVSSNYDMEPLTSPPWWPGVVALLVLAAVVLAFAFIHFKP